MPTTSLSFDTLSEFYDWLSYQFSRKDIVWCDYHYHIAVKQFDTAEEMDSFLGDVNHFNFRKFSN